MCYADSGQGMDKSCACHTQVPDKTLAAAAFVIYRFCHIHTQNLYTSYAGLAQVHAQTLRKYLYNYCVSTYTDIAQVLIQLLRMYIHRHCTYTYLVTQTSLMLLYRRLVCDASSIQKLNLSVCPYTLYLIFLPVPSYIFSRSSLIEESWM